MGISFFFSRLLKKDLIQNRHMCCKNKALVYSRLKTIDFCGKIMSLRVASLVTNFYREEFKEGA